LDDVYFWERVRVWCRCSTCAKHYYDDMQRSLKRRFKKWKRLLDEYARSEVYLESTTAEDEEESDIATG